jgi:hypothetical protein
MGLCSLTRMMGRMECVGMSRVGMVSSRLMMSSRVVSGSFLVMLSGMLVMFGGLFMMGVCRMIVRWFLSHLFSPF